MKNEFVFFTIKYIILLLTIIAINVDFIPFFLLEINKLYNNIKLLVFLRKNFTQKKDFSINYELFQTL